MQAQAPGRVVQLCRLPVTRQCQPRPVRNPRLVTPTHSALASRPMRRPSMTSLLGCLLICAFTANTVGCSFTFIETLPDNPETLPYFDCTSTPGLPVADGVIGVSNAVSAGFTLSESKEEYAEKNDDANRDVVAGVTIALAAISIASGIYGLIQTERCRSAKSELSDRIFSAAERDKKNLVTPVAPTDAPAAPAPATEAPSAAPAEGGAAAPAPAAPVPAAPQPQLIEIAPPTAPPPAAQ